MSRTLPSLDELDRASDLAVDSMRDRCVLLTRATTQDVATGMPIEGWALGAETVCGFAVKSRREGYGSTQVITTVTALRLPLAILAVDTLARVRLTWRRGRELPAPETYDITAATRGTLQWNLELRRVAATLEG
jgi:hypothetical protein